MTDAPTDQPAPSGISAKLTEVGTAAFMKAPQPVQNGLLVGIGKAQPVVSKVQPYVKQVLAGGLGLLALLKVRGRGK